RIQMLRAIFGAELGDDAALLTPPSEGSLVWTVDAHVENVHFRRDWLSWEDLGWRSFMAAARDVAAMGGRAWGALSALALTIDVEDDAVLAIARGQKDAADAIHAFVAGGNLARANEISVTTTVLGVATRPVERRGARPGDGLWLAGTVGLARAG